MLLLLLLPLPMLGVCWRHGLQRARLLLLGAAAGVPRRPRCPCAQHHEAHLYSNVGRRRRCAQAGFIGHSWGWARICACAHGHTV